MNKTLFAILMLIAYGIGAGVLSVWLLNIAGLPGALLAGTPNKRTKNQFTFGMLVSAVGQSYLYLAYVAFVVNWTAKAARREDVTGFILWPVAFLAVIIPMFITVGQARAEARELEHANPQVEALHLTLLLTLVGFFIFAFLPTTMIPWCWVPYMD